jgi:DNA-binding NtrC family response regulator
MRVLVVEDDAAQRTGLTQLVTSWGFDVASAPDGQAALDAILADPPDVVLSDLLMPRMGGLDLLRSLSERHLDVTTLLMTAQATVDSAIEAMRLGAYDYVSKPIDPQRLRIMLDQAADRLARQQELLALRRQLRDSGRFGTLIGATPVMREVYRLLEQVGPTTASVLITGESGTGKELVAQTLHQLSPRAAKPFVAINCAAIPEALLESELFGHERGAFTGALTRRQGSFELADRGTLFLDEIAEMHPTLQAKMLRVLQERVVRPVGGDRDKPIDIRVIAATNVPPATAVADGRLREDLYYRLNVFAVHLPPLRDRLDDLPLLAHAFLAHFAKDLQKPLTDIDDQAIARLRAHTWPGNVRELRNVLERAAIVARSATITAADLPPLTPSSHVSSAPAAAPAASTDEAPGHDDTRLYPGLTVDDAERQLIAITLAHTGNNKTKAAQLLGISLKTLHNKLAREAADAAGRDE